MLDYALVAAVSALGGAAIILATMLIGGFLIAGFLLAPAIGGGAAQLALQLTGRRRGRQSGTVCAGGMLIGGLAAAYLLLGGIGLFTLIYLALALLGCLRPLQGVDLDLCWQSCAYTTSR